MRLAHTAPIRCAGCFCQKPGEPHIDYESAFEGPVDPDRPRGPRVDWLVLCADCVRSGYRLLPDVREPVDELTAQLEAKEQELQELSAYVESLEGAVAARPSSRQSQPRQKAKRRYEPPQED